MCEREGERERVCVCVGGDGRKETTYMREGKMLMRSLPDILQAA